MKIQLAYPWCPPYHDAIGESTVLLAQAIAAEGHEVGIVAAGGSSSDVGATIRWRNSGQRMDQWAKAVLFEVRKGTPDWVLLPYNPFAFGKLGLSLPLITAIFRMRLGTSTRIALLAHEMYSPPRTFKKALMSVAQWSQFLVIGRNSDCILQTTEAGVKKCTRLFPEPRRTGLLPIGSNLPLSNIDKRAARESLGISPTARVVVLFGGLGPHRDDQLIKETLWRAQTSVSDFFFLFVGPNPESVRDLAAPVVGDKLLLLDRPEPATASMAIRSASVAIAPFIDGVSRRRSSFLTMLQHGLPTVTTTGPLLGELLQRGIADDSFAAVPHGDPVAFADKVVQLLVDDAQCEQMSERASRFYQQHFSWSVAGRSVLDAISLAAV